MLIGSWSRSPDSSAGLLIVMCMADCFSKPAIQFAAVEDHLLRMHRLNRVDRHGEVAGILDVDPQLLRRNLPHRAKLLATISSERLKPYFNFFLHSYLSDREHT